MRAAVILYAALIFAGVFGWGMNVYKLTQLDFASPYKAEVIRGVGLFPIFGAIIGYTTIGEENYR